MRVLYALICEDARVREDGRMDVHGVFHELHAAGFPAQQDRMILALTLEWDAVEEGRIQFGVDLVDPGGSPVLTISGHTDVSRAPEGQAPPRTRIVMPLENVVFPRAGTYEFSVRVGDERQQTIPLHLLQQSHDA